MNGTCGPCLIRHCDPNLSRPDFEERTRARKREREVRKNGAERESNVIYGFVSLANIFETAESKTTNRTNGEERPPCNTLKSSFPLHTLKNEKCETRVTVQVDSNASVLWIFLRIPLAIYMATVPLRVTKRSFMSPSLDSYFAKIDNRVGAEKEG